MVMKIEWGADKDTVAFNVFDIGTGGGYVAPTEGAFDATAISITSVNNLDQSTFDTLSFHGSRMNIDEIRLGTTFDAVVNGTETGGGGRPSFAITSIIHLGNAIAIEFDGVNGKEYAVDYKPTLDTDEWQEIDDGAASNGEGSEWFDDSVDTPARLANPDGFYRLRDPVLQPEP